MTLFQFEDGQKFYLVKASKISGKEVREVVEESTNVIRLTQKAQDLNWEGNGVVHYYVTTTGIK